MDFASITELIGTLGFPIICCAALFWKVNKQDEMHKEEMDKLTEVINQNTQAVNKLVSHLERSE